MLRLRPYVLALCLAPVALLADQNTAVFWASSPVQPGETAMLCGAGLDIVPQGMGDRRLGPDEKLFAIVSRLPDFPARAQFAFSMGMDPDLRSPVPVEVLQRSTDCVKFLLPADQKPGVFEFVMGAVPGMLNRPEVDWLQGDQGHAATPGGWLRAFGRCLATDLGPTQIALVKADGPRPARGAEPFAITCDSPTPWSAEVALPANLEPGDYCVSLHSGAGGDAAWCFWHFRQPNIIRIVAPQPWPDKVFNVRDFGATAQGTSDDEQAINDALRAAAENGGGVVYFPRGQYMMTGALQVPPNTTLRGEKREWASIFWPDSPTPAAEALVRGTHHFALEDLTLCASNYTHFIAGDLGREAGGNVRLLRLRVRGDIFRGHLTEQEVADRFAVFMKQSTGGGDTVRLGGPNLRIEDCDLYGAGRSLWLHQADGAVVRGNAIYQGRWGWYSFDGCDGLIFENNTITGADLMSTGGGINCLASPYSRNIYYAGNTLRLMHGWDREAMTTDAGGSAYYGRVKATRDATLTLDELGKWGQGFVGSGVFILGGRGMGQYRRVVNGEGDQVTLDWPFIVQPDATSVLTINMLHENYLFIGNHFEDAGIGIQYYGCSINCVAAGNTAARAGGFYNQGMNYYGYQPSWYCQWLGNEVLEGNGYRFGPNNAEDAGLSFVGSFGVQSGENTAPLCLGSVIRGNKLDNNAKLLLRGLNKDHPGLLNAVVEGNLVANSPVGLQMDDGCAGVLVRNNRFENVTYETYDAATIAKARREALAPYLDKHDPIAYWAFEDADTKRFANSADRKFTAIAEGQVEHVDGAKGKALHFDGKSWLTVNQSEVLNLESFTLSAWVKPDDIAGRWGLIAKRTASAPSPYVLALMGGCIEFDATDSADKWTFNFNSPSVVKPGGWTHIAFTMEQGKQMVMYCNGVQVATKPVPDEPLCTNDQRLTIGYEAWGGNPADGSTPGSFIGAIDEVKLWSRPLSAEEIAADAAR